MKWFYFFIIWATQKQMTRIIRDMKEITVVRPISLFTTLFEELKRHSREGGNPVTRQSSRRLIPD